MRIGQVFSLHWSNVPLIIHRRSLVTCHGIDTHPPLPFSPAAPPDRPDGPGPDQGWHVPLTTYLRFGEWDKVLSAPSPFEMPRDWPFQIVLAHYARGTAFVRKGDQKSASAELIGLRKAAATLTGTLAHYATAADLMLEATLLAETNITAALVPLSQAVDEQVRTSWNLLSFFV